MIGQTISHYKILEKLGEGGMGIVHKAHDTELDRFVALKFLPNYLASDTAERERFYHEARAASALNHPNITTIYEIGRAQDHLFIAMEYVEGRTLKQLIENNPIALNKVLEFAIQICEGLALAAEKGVVHRDIKSDNIMVTPKGQVKIMDFGLAKLKGASRLTKAGSTLGTAAYMSPEQAQGEDVDHRSDIFSFGVVLYEMLTSRLPFKGEHQAALIYSLVNEDPPPIGRFNEKATPELERIISKALAKLREDRYQHIDELLADLRRERKQIEYARTGYVKASTAAMSAEPRRPGKKLSRYLALVAGVVLIAVLVLVFNPFNFQVSLQKSAAGGKNSLAVVYFENIPDPADKDHTADMLTNLLITSLSQARDLEVISRERLFEILKDFGQADAKSISPSLASQVAKRAGVKTMLLGTILEKDPNLVVTTRLIEVESGKYVGGQRLTNFSSKQIFTLVDTLAALVRGSLAVAPASMQESKSVGEITTKSPEAYRYYVQGLEACWKYSWAEARAFLQRAVDLDENFAMAHLVLAATQVNLGDRDGFRISMKKAVDAIDHASEQEKLQILAEKYYWENKMVKAGQTATELIEKYPHEMLGYLQLSAVDQALLETEKAVEVLQRGLKIDPVMKELWNQLTYQLACLDRKEEALNAVDEYLRLAPGEPNPYDTKGDVYAMFGEYDSSRAWYLKSFALRRDFSAGKLMCDAIVRRDYQAAQGYLQSEASSPPYIEMGAGLFKVAGTKVSKSRILRIHLAYETGSAAEMLQQAKELTQVLKKDPNDILYRRDYLAWAYASNRDFLQAHKILDEIQNDVSPEDPMVGVQHDYASAIVAFEEQKFDVAVENFQKVYRRLWPNRDPNLLYGVSLLKRGLVQDARRELERLVKWVPPYGGYLTLTESPASARYWPISGVKANYWLGVAHEEQRDNGKAVQEYEKFLEIWRNADFDSREIRDAKVRLQRLKSVAGK